ncbi:MAG: MFS transporter [Thermoleophilia bacterium]|nr:MFS transporter [Thermoleophilia bacterium]
MESTAGKSIPARVYIAVALVGLGGAWNAGTVGPVASEIAAEFDISLGVVGILSGTLFLGSAVVGLLVAAQIGERIGLVKGLRLSCGLFIAGNLLFAVSPVFATLAVGRVLVGFGFALMNPLGAVWARNAGGVKLIGVFGASIQLGIALALLIGSGLSDAGIDWRVGFLIAAALSVASFLMIPSDAESAPTASERVKGFLGAALRHARVYRLAMLFISIYGVPMVLSAWLIEYLVREGDVRKALAGVIAFVLFGLSALVREFGAKLQERGLPHVFLAGSLGLAAIGLAAITFEPAGAAAFAAVVLIGVGFGIPYATALTEAQDLFPRAPGEPVALMTMAALIPPIIVIPLVGHAISGGEGDIAFGLLAIFVVLATLANLRRTGIPLVKAEEDAA